MAVMKLLVVEDDLRVLRQIRKNIISERSNKNYIVLSNEKMEVYFTSEFNTAKRLIQETIFNAYFLDDQICNGERSEKILSQDRLIELIIKSDSLAISQSGAAYHPIYNISSHSYVNHGGMTRYLSGRCDKTGDAIVNIIGHLARDRNP